jgi:hypothetical protein
MNQSLNEMEEPEFFIRKLFIQLKLLSKKDLSKRDNGWESLFKTLLDTLEGLTDIKRPIFQQELNITQERVEISTNNQFPIKEDNKK